MQLSRDDLLKAYKRMRTIREFEERVHDEFSAGNIPGFVHLYAGEEASGVGVCMHLTDATASPAPIAATATASPRAATTTAMMARDLRHARTACAAARAARCTSPTSTKGMMGANGIVGGGPPLICGAALTAKTLKTGGVAIAFVGDGGSNQGTTFESYNLAKVWNLPAIFVVEDNGYAESTASELVGRRQPARPRGRASACPAIEVDGNDFFAVYEAAREVIERARDGGGPSLIHVKLNRYYGHFEGDAMTYRGARRGGEAAGGEGSACMIFRQRVIEAALLERRRARRDRRGGQVAHRAGHGGRPRRRRCRPRSDLLTDVYVSY